jgi:hypothetical protein
MGSLFRSAAGRVGAHSLHLSDVTTELAPLRILMEEYDIRPELDAPD